MRALDIPNNNDLTLITDSQDLKPILDNLGINQFIIEQGLQMITGVLVNLENAFIADFDPSLDIWLTEASKPWSQFAEWERPGYYADASEEELFLQD